MWVTDQQPFFDEFFPARMDKINCQFRIHRFDTWGKVEDPTVKHISGRIWENEPFAGHTVEVTVTSGDHPPTLGVFFQMILLLQYGHPMMFGGLVSSKIASSLRIYRENIGKYHSSFSPRLQGN